MKKHFTLLISLCLSSVVLSQDLEGNYKGGNDSFSFSDKKATFNVSGFGALSTRMVGEGDYEYFDNYLLIKTGEYSGEKSVVESINGSKKDSVVIKVVDPDNYAIQGVLTEFFSESDKVIHTGITNARGKVGQANDQKTRKIKVSSVGYNDIVFDAIPGKDFLVKLAKHNVIENQTVVFKINKEGEEIISIILLSDNFEPGKNRMKSLERLDKKVQKSNTLSRRLKKEYVPIYGR